MSIVRRIKDIIRRTLIDHYPRLIVEHEWPGVTGRRIDWKNPKDINEKIQWLICFSDISEWSRLTDKVLVREYIKKKGLEDLLPRLYGVWDDANDIILSELPDKFVLKCNHDSGSIHVIDKSKSFDFEAIKKKLNDLLRIKFGYVGCEPHYNRIKPRIIAEELLESHDPEAAFSSSLIDYKVWCFNGEPHSFLVCYGRDQDHDIIYLNEYDLDWNVHPEYSVFDDHFLDGEGKVKKPKTFTQMLDSARALSEGFPEVRVDFYEVDGKLYFGEMTFTSLAGRMPYYTNDYLIELGSKISLPKR